MASASCEFVSVSTAKLAERSNEFKRETLRILQFQHRDLQGSFQPRILPLKLKELIRKIVMLSYLGGKSQNCISIISLFLPHFGVGRRISRPKYVPVQVVLRMLCCGSKRGGGGQISGRSCDVGVNQRA